MNFNTLQYFIDIVESRSFTKAAERNYVSQTALSHAITKLERELNVQLLVRVPGQVVPTEAGGLFYRECREILKIHWDTLKAIGELIPKKQRIRIGFIDIYECRSFKKLQEQMEFKFPQYVFEWVDRYSVQEKEMDLIIGYDFELKADRYSGNLEFCIPGDDLVCLASVNHELAHKKVIKRKDIAGYTLILLVRDRKMNIEKYEKNFRQRYFNDIPFHIRFAYSSLERRTLVECNSGIAIFEKNIFKYDPCLCRPVGIADCYDIRYSISYRDKSMGKIAEEIRVFFGK